MKCFYHADIDGKCSAAIVKKYYNDIPDYPAIWEFIPINYNDDFPFDKIMKDEPIIIVDFSLQKIGDFEKLLQITKDIIWIDHHKTAIEKHPNMSNLEGIRDINYAGCELTWIHFYSYRTFPLAVEYAGRYDVWDFFKHGEKLNIFQAGIRLHPNEPTDPVWQHILNDDSWLDEIMDQGKIALKYRKHVWADLIKSWSFWAEFEGYKTICCNAGSVSSQLFDSIEEDYDIMMSFVFDGKQWTVSLYTKKDIDVSEIAKKYGGGGHKGAAGFQCKTLPFKKK